MTKHLVFLAHGMGNFSKGWSADLQQQIKALYSAYGISQTIAFDDTFEFKEINYNDRFDKLRAQWKSDAAAVLKVLGDNGLQAGAVNELAQLGAAPSVDHFLATHLLDVFLYRFVPTVAEATRVSVARQIISAILDTQDLDVPRWSVIAHSLGTAVVHDALHAAFTSVVDGRTLQGVTKARLLAMVANVSRLVENDIDVYRSVVHPGPGSRGVCLYYQNIKHEWDPFPRPREFRPLDDWPDIPARQQKRYEPISINAFQKKNIHALTHYLANPQVHIPIFRKLLGLDNFIPGDELDKAQALFEANTPFGAFEGLQNRLKDFQIAEQATWRQVIKAFNAFLETVDTF